MSVAVMVLSVSVIENALRATVKPPNISRERGEAPRSMPSAPLKPGRAEMHVVEIDTRTVRHVEVYRQTVLAADGQDVAAQRSVDLAQQPAESAVLDQARSVEIDMVWSRGSLCRRREALGQGCELLGDFVKGVAAAARLPASCKQVPEQRRELAG